MDANEAKATARDYINELFADEGIMNVGLEEIAFQRSSNEWRVTYGFARPWTQLGEFGIKMGLNAPRTYKVVSIDDRTGVVLALTDRQLDAPKS